MVTTSGRTHFSLGDLLAMIAGIALVLSLPWEFPTDVPMGRGIAVFRDGTIWSFLAETLGKACLVLVPVVIVRGFQLGTPMQRGEFLSAVGGLPWLFSGGKSHAFVSWVAMRMRALPEGARIPAEFANDWVGLTFWPFLLGPMVVAGLAWGGLALRRSRWPSWVVTMVIMIGWLGLRESLLPLGRTLLFPLIPGLGLAHDGFSAMLIDHVVLLTPFLMLYTVPALASLGVAPGDQRRWTWVGMASTVLAFIAMTILVIDHERIAFTWAPPESFWAGIAVEASCAVASVVLGMILVRRISTRWNEWVGLNGTRGA